MKKFVFLFTALLLVCASLGFSQMTNSEILKVILRSKEINHATGITDPNKILPGQKLTFLFTDGSEHLILVEKGDCQWTILRDKLHKLEATHGPIVNYPSHAISTPKQAPRAIKHMPAAPEKVSFLEWISTLPWWAYLLFILGIFVLYALISGEREKRMKINPITAGPAQVPGGVNDANAHSRMNTIAQSRFPGARLNIRNIRRGHLSGKGMVHYAEGTKPKKINLDNIAAYAGEITINGTDEQTIYFLQGCGNDTAVSHMSGDELVFTPDVVINPDGSESPIPSVETPAIEPVVENSEVSVPADHGSEFHQHVDKAQQMVGEFLNGNDAKHKVVLKITHDTFEVTIENRYDQPKQKPSSQEGK